MEYNRVNHPRRRALSLFLVPDSRKDTLQAADAPMQVCIADSCVIGYFTPTKEVKLNLDSGISKEELDRRFATGTSGATCRPE